MAGNALTNQFNIGTATVMVGPMADVLKLTPEQHSIGLVKAVTLTSETNEVTLTQGIRNTIVDSQVTGVTSKVSMEVYEYTAKNLAYAAQLDGSTYSTGQTMYLKTAITGGVSATSVVLKADSDVSSSFTKDTRIQIQATGDKKYDKVFIGVLASDSTYDSTAGSLTLTLTEAIPAGWSFKVDDEVLSVSVIPVGSDRPQPYYGVKIVGILPNGNEPVTIIIPKAKVTSGITLGFNTDNYGNLPFEFTPYDLTAEDSSYSTFSDYGASVLVYKR